MSKAIQKARDAATERAKKEEAARPRQIITPQIKSDKQFQIGLANFSRSDARHDLKAALNFDENPTVNAFNQGLPVHSTTTFHETEMLYFVMNDCPPSITTQKGRDEAVGNLLDNITNVNTGTAPQAPTTLKIGYRDSEHLISIDPPLYNYTGVKFNIPCSNNRDNNKYGTPCTTNWGRTFVQNALGGSEAAFIVDFSQHHFMEKLVQGEEYKDFTVHYLMTPEVVNDPAGKPNVDNKTIFSTNTGINLYSYVQRDIDPVCYTPFDKDESNPLNNFFSLYDYTVSPIKQIFTKGKSSQLVTTLDVKYTSGKTQPYTAIIEDSKKENSITNVLGYIKKILLQQDLVTKPQLVFNFNVKCQQKRGGDWFQVLCCLDARKRTYTRILPNDDTRAEWKIPQKCPVYFVSHDQIAVAYALLNGVNVIYIDAFGRVFVFKNQADPSLEGTGKPITEILFDGMKSRYPKSDSLDNLISWAKKYSVFRTSFIEAETITYNSKLSEAVNDIQKINISDISDIGYYTKQISNILKSIFTAAVRLMFVKINFIEVSSQTAYVDRNKSYLSQPYASYAGNPDTERTIHKLSDNINLIQGIINKYGEIPENEPRDEFFKTKMGNWVSNHVKNLDVYRAAQNIDLLERIKESTVVNRIINFVKATSNKTEQLRSTDKYIFLPFIQTLSSNNDTSTSTDELSLLIDLLNNILKPNLDSFLNNTQPSSKLKGIIDVMKRKTRTGLEPKETVYNNALNLIYEANILLKIEENATDFLNKDDVPLLESTDNILLAEDDLEINELNAGKISFYNAYQKGFNDVGDVIQQGGVNFNSMSDQTPDTRIGNFKPVVCDITIRQITWPLLNSIFIDSMTKENAIKLAEAFVKYKSDPNITENNWEEYLEKYGLGWVAAGDFFETTLVNQKAAEKDVLQNDIVSKISKEYLPNKNEFGIMISAAASGLLIDYLWLTPAATTISPVALPIVAPVIAITAITSSAVYAYRKYNEASKYNASIPRGGAEETGVNDIISSTSPSNTQSMPESSTALIDNTSHQNIDLLKNFDLGYHPLVPIYMLLEPFYYTLSPKYESHPFFYTYFTYVNVLEKMINVIDTNYLNDPLDVINIFAAYYIGRSLGTFLITSNTSMLQNNKILEIIGMSQEDYYTFSLTNASFANLFIGSVHLTPEEELLGLPFIDSELFKNFINVEVNIKQILEQGTPVEGLPSYMDLKDRIRNLIHRIVVKVNVDRGTPLAAEIDDAIAAGIQIPDDAIVEDIQTPDNAVVEDIQRPDDIVEDIQTPDDANKQKMINFRFKRPGNRLPLTAIPTRVRGGKMTKNRCKKRVSTRKNKKTKLIKSSKKTRKHKRSHKRSRKNLN